VVPHGCPPTPKWSHARGRRQLGVRSPSVVRDGWQATLVVATMEPGRYISMPKMSLRTNAAKDPRALRSEDAGSLRLDVGSLDVGGIRISLSWVPPASVVGSALPVGLFPFERRPEVLNPVRSLSRHPLFQVMLVLQNTPRAGSIMDLPGLATRREQVALATAKFDLSLSLMGRRGSDATPEGIDGVLEFSTDLFDRPSVESMVVRLICLCEAVVADPHQPIGLIEILSPKERHQLLVGYNDTVRDVPAATLPELFEAQVQRTPENTAAVFEDTSVSLNTYQQLNARANQLARLLIDRGVGAEDFVALALPRSLGMVVAVLAVLKAGAAYLPLDPDYPPARIAFMLDDAHPACLITTTATALPATGLPVIVLDHDHTRDALTSYPDTDSGNADCTRPLDPRHPAYVISLPARRACPKGWWSSTSR